MNIEWMAVAGGPFWMGHSEQDLEALEQDPNKDGLSFEELRRQVYSPTFKISKYPVTNRQFVVFLNELGIQSPAITMLGASLEEKLDHPVRFLRLYDALRFCNWANCRLPTEVEWEKAARGENGFRYSWGDEWKPEHCNGGYSDPRVGTTPVSQFLLGASPYGVMDMVGNVFELTSSIIVAASDPRNEYFQEYVVLKGGTCYSSQKELMCANRYIHYNPNNLGDFVGFRCVKLE